MSKNHMKAEIDHPGCLGLASVRERLKRLGETLEISSTPGKGTPVKVRLPKMEVSHE